MVKRLSVSRKLLGTIVVILALHFIGIPLLGDSLAGSILGNSLQVAASGLAAAYAVGAYRRAQGASRHFWLLVTASFLSWTVANLGWMYYEDGLRVPIPSPSWVHFFYDVPGGFLAMSLFLDEERDSARLDAQTLLDFLQIGILICFLYFDLYYIPSRGMSFHAALVRDTIIADTENLVLVLLAVIRIRRARPIQLRTLYWGLTFYLGFFALAAGIADYGQIYKGVATGSWYDLGWTVPFLVAAVMADSWRGTTEPDSAAAHRSATLPDLAATNLALAFAPLFVVVQSVRLPAEWRWVGIVTVVLSGGCYAARLVLTQFRQIRAAETHRQSLGLLRSVIEAATDAIFLKDLQGRYLMINCAGAQMLKRPVEDVLGKTDLELFADETGKQTMERDRLAIASGESKTYEETATVAGISRTFLSTKGPYRDASGAVVGLLGISRDITERKLAGDKFRSLVQNSFDLITTIGADGVIQYVSPSVTRILGYSATDLLGKNAFDYIHPDDLNPLQALFAEGLKEPGSTRQAEYRFRHADGSWVEFWAVGTNLLHDPSVEGIVVNCRDITQQKRDAKARAEAEIRYRTLVEQLASITYIAKIGLEGEWLYVSPQIHEMLGFTPEEWLADPKIWISRVHPDDRALVESAESATFSGGPFRAEYRMYRRDSQIIWVNDTASVMRDSEGNILLQGVLLDVTDRKQLESQLREAQKMQAVGRLAGGIAHDFNNMLTVITGYAQALLERKNPPEEVVRRGAEHIRSAADRAASLTRQLLAFGRKQMLEPRIINLNSVMVDMDKLMRRFLAENIEVVLKPGLRLGSVKADPAQIEQVILNLVINARDAMPDGGQLTLETSNTVLDQAYADDHASVRPGSYVMLAVSDTGIGMDAQTLARVFEPFFTTKEMGKGTGLGLSTVYGIVKQSDGYIWVYSEPGRGSTFKVYFPRVDQPAENAVKEKRPQIAARGTESILLVEDDKMLRDLAQSVLHDYGYSVLAPERVDEVESLCQKHPDTIHLLLTDVVMPGVSGHELARRVTALRPGTKVLYMSGYADNAIVHRGLLDPGISFLPKPFTPGALASKVREVLDNGDNRG